MEESSVIRTAPVSSIAMAMLFGSVTFATTAISTRIWLTGDNRAIFAALHPKSDPLDVTSLISIYSLLYHSTIFGFILFFAYICEYHPPFPHAEKSYDRDEFYFLIAVIIVLSFYTIRKNDHKNDVKTTKKSEENKFQKNHQVSEFDNNESRIQKIDRDDSTFSSYTPGSPFNTKSNFIHVAPVKACDDLLNRNQTEEWKGWMQFVFLLYHYYHAEEVYNSIRVMITCYVWMTGFGNFSFFYLKGDYSFVRVLQMLWRLNFLVLFLCLSQGTTYILYYICPLHTYFFLMVYFTMGVGRHLNYSKHGLRLKLGLLALVIYFFWDVDSGLFRLIHFPLGSKPQLGAINGTLWEWYFRSTLDHWSTFLGMCFALNYPITSLFYRKLEALPPIKCWTCKGLIALSMIAVCVVWAFGPFAQDKFAYNATNPYFGFIPLLTYIFLRNLTPILRKHYLHLLHEIGKTTLETYLMQHHIWLTSNAKSLLVFIPGWPKVNMLIVTLIYFYTSRKLYRLTLYLRGMLLPDNRRQCISSMLWLASTIILFYLAAFCLESFGLSSLTSIAIITTVCGTLLYRKIMYLSWDSYKRAPKTSDEGESFINAISLSTRDQIIFDSSFTRFSPLVIGTMVICIVGLSWHEMAITGAGKIKPLHAGCDILANKGHWVGIDGCGEDVTGAAYRNHGISNFASCNSIGSSHVWGWEISPSSTHCRFIQRTEKQLLKALNHQRITFVGDSMTRNLYHAFCRQLGIKNAGEFDATGPKHQDITRVVKNTGVEFKWAPLASNQLSTIRNVLEQIKHKDASKCDLVVVGGGAWDRLHLYATDEDKQSLLETLGELKEEFVSLRQYGIPVVWVTPTVINTKALNTPEKQDHMTEEDMADMRNVYEDAGITSSSSFVIHGPSFTKERVEESYDGVHYPLDVYNAGAQIFANSLDWLIEEKVESEQFTAPEVGAMANPLLGLMMLCLAFISLLFYDGFLGFSYLAGLFAKVLPIDLYLEAFTTLHEKMRLPRLTTLSSSSIATNSSTSQITNNERNS